MCLFIFNLSFKEIHFNIEEVHFHIWDAIYLTLKCVQNLYTFLMEQFAPLNIWLQK